MVKIKNFWKIDPREVTKPLIMVLFGLIGFIISIYSENLTLDITFWFMSLLPIVMPISTLKLVLLKYKEDRRNNLLKRMLITSSLGFFMILIFFLLPIAKHFILILVSSGGLLYFLYDYLLQGELYLRLKNNPKSVLNNETRFRKVMETNCSRSVLHEYLKKINTHEGKKNYYKDLKNMDTKNSIYFQPVKFHCSK